jgi:hypothetical protein
MALRRFSRQEGPLGAAYEQLGNGHLLRDDVKKAHSEASSGPILMVGHKWGSHGEYGGASPWGVCVYSCRRTVG